LIEKYPAQPAALEAMQRLVQLWGSAEVTWRRLRKSVIEEHYEENRPELIARAAIELVEAKLQKQARRLNRTIFDDDEPRRDPVKNDADKTQPPAQIVERARTIRKDIEPQFLWWQTRALKMGRELERRDPALAAQPTVQFPLAAAYRGQTSFSKSDAIYRRFVERGAAAAWLQAASAEIWLAEREAISPSPTTPCGFTSQRPVLDGLLDDPCWQEAAEVPLAHSTSSAAEKARPVIALFAFDARYFYFAANVPCRDGFHRAAPAAVGRRHDDDLSDYDRILISLDIDRDYVTAFHFAVDQRGCTAESCWLDPSWDPRWFVAAVQDAKEWRVEAAIPLDELTPLAPLRGSAWALGITRIVPAVAVESWISPARATPRPEESGLLVFDAPAGVR
jgi:hypothetical protein